MSRPTARSPGWLVHPRGAPVGGVLKRLPEGSTCLPWHRVVNRHGDISLTGPDLQRQRQALLAEGCRSPAAAISISSIIAGFIEGKKAPIRGVASYWATGTAVCWTGTSVRSA